MMKSAPAKKAVKGYNKLAAVLVEYEMLYHQAWVAEVRMCMVQCVMLHVLFKMDCLLNRPLNWC